LLLGAALDAQKQPSAAAVRNLEVSTCLTFGVRHRGYRGCFLPVLTTRHLPCRSVQPWILTANIQWGQAHGVLAGWMNAQFENEFAKRFGVLRISFAFPPQTPRIGTKPVKIDPEKLARVERSTLPGPLWRRDVTIGRRRNSDRAGDGTDHHCPDRHHPFNRDCEEECDHDGGFCARRRAGRKCPQDAIFQAWAACRLGTGSELRRPLGIAIAGGLIVSQMLTLFTTPVIYLSLDNLRIRFSRRPNRHRPSLFIPGGAAESAD
jgi:hypothetical protein